MPKLMVFDHLTLDGYFTSAAGDLSWAHAGAEDAEWRDFVAGNVGGDGLLVFGRVTYQLMAGYWPTPMAAAADPVVAAAMNTRPKLVFSRTLDRAAWSNTTLVRDDLAGEIRRRKDGTGPDLVILGSGSLVAQLTRERLIDEYQLVLNPVALGGGRTLFEGLEAPAPFRLTSSRAFANGRILACYRPA